MKFSFIYTDKISMGNAVELPFWTRVRLVVQPGTKLVVLPMRKTPGFTVRVVRKRKPVNLTEARTILEANLRRFDIPDAVRQLTILNCSEQLFGRVSRARGLDPEVDLKKVITVASLVMEIAAGERTISSRETSILITAALLHGVGWYSPKILDCDFRNPLNRRIAMQEVGPLAYYILRNLAKNPAYAFTPEAEREIIRLVGQYDNPSLSPPEYFTPKDRLGLNLREADRLYMLTEEGLSVDLERRKDGIDIAGMMLTNNAERIRRERKYYEGHPAYGVDEEGSRKLFATATALRMYHQMLGTLAQRMGVDAGRLML